MTPTKLAIALTLALAGAPLLPSAATGSTGATCHGLPATLVASSGDVDGTDGNDVIVVTGKVHYLDAKGGDDLVCVLDVTRTPTVWSGLGDDVIDASGATGKVSAAHRKPGTDTSTGSAGTDDSVSARAPHAGGRAPRPGSRSTTRSRARLRDHQPRVRRGRPDRRRPRHGCLPVARRGPASAFDLGAGRDGIGIEDDFEGDPEAGRTSLTRWTCGTSSSTGTAPGPRCAEPRPSTGGPRGHPDRHRPGQRLWATA